MDLKLLRDATRPEHEATEAAVPLMGPDLTRADYISVLQRFHGVVCAWDTVAATEAPESYTDLVKERRRCGSLEADLRFLGAAIDGEASEDLLQQIRAVVGSDGGSQPEERDSRFLGAMYVLEGSTLGGQYIAHHVESALHLQSGQGDSFFRGYGKETMPKWREFQQVLAAIPDSQSEQVIAAAKAMFGIFREWMAPRSLSQDEKAASNFAAEKKLAGVKLHLRRAEAS